MNKGFLRLFPVAVLTILLGWCNSVHGAFTTLWVFTNGADGSFPATPLVQGSDSNFYGTTAGSTTYGSIFQITSTGSLTPLYQFSGGTDGGEPFGGLVQASDTRFYGTTSTGGSGNNGTVFRLTSTGGVSTTYRFVNGTDGSSPQAGLVQGSDSNFYGTTYGTGGSGGSAYGTVFKVTPAGVPASLHDFTGGNGGPDGAYPAAPLIRGPETNLTFYGTTSLGGTNSNGTVFKITSAGTLTILYRFSGGADGGIPFAGLVMGSDSNFYGTTYEGGTNACSCGTVFQISTTGTLTTLHSFSAGADGAFPEAELVQGSDGLFYGTASQGGTNDNGTLFSISSTGAFTPLYQFTNGLDGANPYAPLIQGSDGSFYGTASAGGTNDNGTVFKFAGVVGCNSNFMPQVSAIQIVGTNVLITVPTVACQTYQLQYSDEMVPTNWINIGSATPGTGNPIQLTAPVGSMCSPEEACLPSPSGLVSWWPGDGNALDLAGGNNNGVMSNGATFASGEVCQAFSFTNNGAVVVIGNPPNLQLNVFTIELWFRCHNPAILSTDSNSVGQAVLFGYSTPNPSANPGGGYCFLLVSPSGGATMGLTESGYSHIYAAGPAVTDTNWHHGAVTWSGSSTAFYLDGNSQGNQSCVGSCFNFQFTVPAAIGSFVPPIKVTGQPFSVDSTFNGDIDEVSVYNRVLSAAEIQAIYNAGAAGKCKPTAGLHRFYRVDISH